MYQIPQLPLGFEKLVLSHRMLRLGGIQSMIHVQICKQQPAIQGVLHHRGHHAHLEILSGE